MTASGAPQSDDTGPRQEGIWEDSSDTGVPTEGAAGVDSGRAAGLRGTITSTVGTPGPAGLIYADLPNRIMALIIDIIVLSVIGFALAWFFGGLVSEPGALDASGGDLHVGAFVLVLLLQLGVSFAYFGGSWTLAGATAGMRVLGLRIGSEADGGPISWRHALTRWLFLGVAALLASLGVYVPSTIGVVLMVVGLLWMLVLLYTIAQSPTRQGLQDRYGHTIVVKVRRRA